MPCQEKDCQLGCHDLEPVRLMRNGREATVRVLNGAAVVAVSYESQRPAVAASVLGLTPK